jgi:hypothetical protein
MEREKQNNADIYIIPYVQIYSLTKLFSMKALQLQ